jgi:Icc protein
VPVIADHDTADMRKYFPILFMLAAMLMSACEKMEYSPNQAFSETSAKDLNRKNIHRLLATPNDDTLRIAFIGDTQRFYDECEMFVNAVNAREGVDLVMIAGDISQYGLTREFEWITNIFNRLRMPYVSIVGNHDLVGNGVEMFKHTFGPLDFTFEYDSVRFVCHNTNSREYGFNGSVPDIGWLQQQMSPGPGIKRILPVSHVPPYDADFDKKLEQQYAGTLNSSEKVSLSLHGHVHYVDDHYPYNDGVRYFNGYAMDKRTYAMVEIVGEHAEITMVEY